MKITNRQIRQIIKEELRKVLSEGIPTIAVGRKVAKKFPQDAYSGDDGLALFWGGMIAFAAVSFGAMVYDDVTAEDKSIRIEVKGTVEKMNELDAKMNELETAIKAAGIQYKIDGEGLRSLPDRSSSKYSRKHGGEAYRTIYIPIEAYKFYVDKYENTDPLKLEDKNPELWNQIENLTVDLDGSQDLGQYNVIDGQPFDDKNISYSASRADLGYKK